MMKKKRKDISKCMCCEDCSNLIPIGEGDHVCMEGKEPKMPISEYLITEEYMWCDGKYYEE